MEEPGFYCKKNMEGGMERGLGISRKYQLP